MEQLINTADGAVEIKESRQDKGHAGDFRMRDEGETPERGGLRRGAMRRAATSHITYAPRIICLGMIIDFPVDIQMGDQCGSAMM